MFSGSTTQGADAYRKVGAHGHVATADPRKLVGLLLDGAIERVVEARGHLDRKEVARKGEALGRALAIIGELNGSLDFERGGEIAVNLHRLYDYICRRITEANLHNDGALLDEVAGLLREIKAGWDAVSATSAVP